jgi:hypothetical protein
MQFFREDYQIEATVLTRKRNNPSGAQLNLPESFMILSKKRPPAFASGK